MSNGARPNQITVSDDWPVKDPYGTGLWLHQKRALAKSFDQAAHFFAMDPGLGKSATVIAEAGAMFLSGEIDTLIVIAPNRVHRQWVEKQMPLWAGVPWVGWVWPKGGLSSERRKQHLDAVLQVRVLRPRLRVLAFNFEAIRIPRGRNPKIPEAIRVIERAVATSKLGVYVACDEIHRIKDHQSAQTRGLMRLGRGVAKVRRGLSGTPVLQGTHDLYSQYAFLDPKIIGEESFYSFRSRFCKTAPVPNQPRAARIVGPRNTATLMKRIEPFTSRVLAEDALDMPPQSFDLLEVEMEPAQAKAYASMHDMMMVGIRDTGQVIAAPIVIAQLQKLQQIACLAGDTEVLTERGWVPMEKVLPSDRVWDGVEWVVHDGLALSGVAATIECFGVRMTPEHGVLTGKGWRHGSDCTGLNRAPVRLPHGYSEGWDGLSEAGSLDLPLRVQGETRNDPHEASEGVGDMASSRHVEPVYDLINCGPRHRFVVRGKDGIPLIVHNSGFVFDEDRAVHWLSTAKVDAIADQIDDLNRPVVVWAPWIPLLDKLEEVLRGRGGVTRYRSLADIDTWRAKGTGRNPILANPASGGTGVDGLQFASWAIYAANSFSLEHRDQSVKRTHRGGQRDHCFYLDAVSRGTRDIDVVEALAAKKEIGAMSVDQLRDMLLREGSGHGRRGAQDDLFEGGE